MKYYFSGLSKRITYKYLTLKASDKFPETNQPARARRMLLNRMSGKKVTHKRDTYLEHTPFSTMFRNATTKYYTAPLSSLNPSNLFFMTNKRKLVRKHLFSKLIQLAHRLLTSSQMLNQPYLQKERGTVAKKKFSKMKITFIFHFDTHKTTTLQQGKHNSYTKHM